MLRTHTLALCLTFAIAAAFASTPSHAVQRAHVSAAIGNDANTATNCTVAAPCRFFQAAMSVTDSNGEVVVLDSGGYGAITATKSIAFIAPSGVYAGISVFPGAIGVTIATPGINVILRGLTINGQGGLSGVSMTAGAGLAIENCVIANFASGDAVLVEGNFPVRVTDTLLRDNLNGIHLRAGARGTITRTTILRSQSFGIILNSYIPGTVTTADISDVTVAGASIAIGALSQNTGSSVRAAVIRSTATSSDFGVYAESTAGLVVLTLSESLVVGNTNGLARFGAGTTFETLGNNTVRQNSTNVVGIVSTVAPI